MRRGGFLQTFLNSAENSAPFKYQAFLYGFIIFGKKTIKAPSITKIET